ncbi:hypothetical protein IMSHALPRED_008491 [Imshaugia aleurites]|uniref:Uncharacterized protein n=1 Tax=Imshaugia aleurites TaxID=172621 RepID=A0A8H3I9B9_9LECA|nr:hypothetical protein IMSHALPRED_008491 [Imshaugia aleurites]
MSDHNNNTTEREAPELKTNEPVWVNIDLEPRNVDPNPHSAKATVVDQVPRWSDSDLEARSPSKSRSRRFGIALAAMVLTGILAPMVVAIRNEEAKGEQ